MDSADTASREAIAFTSRFHVASDCCRRAALANPSRAYRPKLGEFGDVLRHLPILGQARDDLDHGAARPGVGGALVRSGLERLPARAQLANSVPDFLAH